MSNPTELADTDTDTIHLGDENADNALTRLRIAVATKTELDNEKALHEWNRMKVSKDAARIFSFIGPVITPSAQACMDTIGQWSREDSEAPIHIVFNSPGGAVMDGLALYDYIDFIRTTTNIKFTTTVLGEAASMAAILLQAGDKRVMGKNAYIMIHEISSGAIGSMSEIEDASEFAKRLNRRVIGLIAERSGQDYEALKEKWLRKEYWLDADEALAEGFCDAIQ